MKIAIRSRWDNSVLFEAEIADDVEEGWRIRAAVEIAVGKRARLVGARLDGARLDGANALGLLNHQPFYPLFRHAAPLFDSPPQLGPAPSPAQLFLLCSAHATLALALS